MVRTERHLPPPQHPLFDHAANPITAYPASLKAAPSLKELEELIQYWKDYLPFLRGVGSAHKRHFIKRTILALEQLLKGLPHA